MKPKNTTKETFQVIGIKIVTSSQKAMEDIPKLWERFFVENVKNKVSNKLNDDIFVVYTDYEGDYTKPYSYTLGYEVSSLDVVPDGMSGITVPSAQYEVFIAKGKIPDIVVETWLHIWQPEIDEKRSYTVDFEVYKGENDNPENSEVEICIAVK